MIVEVMVVMVMEVMLMVKNSFRSYNAMLRLSDLTSTFMSLSL